MSYNIITNRLLLRPPLENDATELFNLMKDKRITSFLTWEAHADQNITLNLIHNLVEAQTNEKAFHWCILLDSKIIGLVSLIDVRRKIRTWTIDRAELSYWISPEFQGKGYATEAAKAVVGYGFGKLHFHKIIVAHASKNIESKRICEKLGFIQYAHEHDAFCKDGVWNDIIWYEKIKQTNGMD